ncbi:hypothetical protein ACUNV4_23660 [Granulosicoccus sp. 3-233]|uniref:hypothetical protein n=1 Tax=Granulosicoccus sp. 3-233 TaxID=3417969 RepID=UPI003D34A64E
MLGGVAVIDITPPAGLLMSGFAARSRGAVAAHDRLSVRAIVLDDTALLVCDVIGLHEDMSARIRKRACLPEDNIVITALHTHGAPASMKGRLGEPCDHTFLETLEQACVDAIQLALDNARSCTLVSGSGLPPGIARNRRDPDGEVDDQLPTLQLLDLQGMPFAMLVSYACHPVVLGADNLHYTADYPHYVRQHIEELLPGCTAVFALGAAGDINSGHSAQSSISLTAQADRTFEEAERIGVHIAKCALRADLQDAGGGAHMINGATALDFVRRETMSNAQLIRLWQDKLRNADPARANLLHHWIQWAEQDPSAPLTPWPARTSLVYWGRISLIALPGEQFATVAIQLRKLLQELTGRSEVSFVLPYAEGNPGYICPDDAFDQGGYEPDEAHRYYGQPASFAPGSVDRLLNTVRLLLKSYPSLQQP